MYLEFYRLRENPFSLTPDPTFLFYSNVHKRAIAFLKYGLQESKGFLLLTGPVGSGKTTLLRAILGQLDENTKTAYIINPVAPFPDLLRSIMKDLEIPDIPPTRVKMELLDFFHDYLLGQFKRSRPVIVIFDEAQNLSQKNLEEIRMLSNFETTKGKLIQIALVGQPELRKTLERRELRQLRQRIQVRYHLAPLDFEEVKAYINHRLRIAGSPGDVVFSDEACKAIYEFSRGIPRLINSVCDVVLLIGYVSERKTFDEGIVHEALAEMNGSFKENDDYVEDDEAVREETFSSVGMAEDPNTEDSESVAEPHPEGEGDEGASSGLSRPGTLGESVYEPPTNELSQPTVIACKAPVAKAVATRPDFAASRPGSAVGREDPEVKKQKLIQQATEPPTQSPKPVDDASKASPSATTPEKAGLSWGARLWWTIREYAFAGRRHRPEGSRGLPGGSAVTITPRNSESCPGILDKPSGHSRKETVSVHQADGEYRYQSVDAPSRAVRSGERGKSRHPSRGGGWRSRRNREMERQSPERNVIVVFKNGRTAKGRSGDISVKMSGFYFSPHDRQNGSKNEFVPYDEVIAVRTVGDSDKGWETAPPASDSDPKGQQVIVTLANGEVIDGMTLSRFDPNCQRFFVVCSGSDGDACSTLVERTGTAGILTEDFAEGTYAEEFESFLSVTGKSEMALEPMCQHESAGDLYFSLNDFESALSEYEKALEGAVDEERVALKISLSRFNRGVKFTRGNRFHEAKREFEQVVSDDCLRKKAKSKMDAIERILRT